MEARTSTPQRLPKSENPPEYEKIVSNSNFNDNCSVYSDVSRATSRASRSRRQKSSRDKSVSIQAPSKSTRYTEGELFSNEILFHTLEFSNETVKYFK